MTTPQFITGKDGRQIQITPIATPELSEEQVPVLEAVPETEAPAEAPAPVEQDANDMSDLTHLSEGDRDWQFGTSGLIEDEDEDDLSDLVDVSDEDIMGEAPKPKQSFRRVRRIVRRSTPPSSLSGMR